MASIATLLGLSQTIRTMPVSKNELSRLELRPGDFWHQADIAGLSIKSLKGTIWITEEGDMRDGIIRAGECFSISGNGLVVLEALTEAQISIIS
jgi:hypothetical protein